VDEKRAVAGAVRCGEDGAGDEVAPPLGHASEPADRLIEYVFVSNL
jgi:hypothetical protein